MDSSRAAPNGLADLCQQLVRSVCPLFVLTAPGQPFLIGTGVPVQIGRIAVIVTAAHVLRPYGQVTVLTMGTDHAIDLTGKRRLFDYIPVQTADVDLAVIILNDIERAELYRHYDFSYSMNFASPAPTDWRMLYAVVGFPQSQNKRLHRLRRSNRPVADYYVSPNRIPVSQVDSPGKYEEIHFAIGAPPRRALGMNGQRVNFPSPAGVSGGGVWRLDSAQANRVARAPRLVGILIEHCKRPGVFICTRIRELELMTRDLR